MSQGRYYAIATFVILCQAFTARAVEVCTREHRSIYGRMLKGHTFAKTKATNWPQCITACNESVKCQSVNYAIDEGMCELNNRTKQAKPEDLVPARHRAYMTRPEGRVPLGSIPELPAQSCTEIQQSEGETMDSGFYWLDSISSGNVKQSYCVVSPECINYQNLTDGHRKVTAGSDPLACDKHLGPAWFRFVGDAGTKMPTSCVAANACGAHAPGWLNGTQPTVAEGLVTRQVCFTWHNCCTWDTHIQVRNCGDFHVYFLDGTSSDHPCNLRFCGTD